MSVGSGTNVGDVLVAQGKLDEALKAYRDSLPIRERLAAADRSNTEWQRDLAVSYAKLASVYLRLGNSAEALAALHKGRDIWPRLSPSRRATRNGRRSLRGSTNRSPASKRKSKRRDGIK
jgi:tetratricopeptide (TPR) repeat protein